MKTIIQTPTNNLNKSIDFYRKANFVQLSERKPTLFSNNNTIIEINDDRYARSGLKLYQASWKNEVNALNENTSIIQIPEGYLLSDPSGMWIYLIEKDEPSFSPLNNNVSVFGNFAGISLETMNVNLSILIFETLGFSKSGGDINLGWLSLTNEDNLSISLMVPNSCPHLFFNPSLTYFNGENNIDIIRRIKELKIPITEEITHFNANGIVDNIIIRDPGGFGIFLFSD